MCFWDRIINELKERTENIEEWSEPSLVIPQHDNICGVRALFDNGKEVSIISHKYSYGGNDDEFEIMPGNYEDVDGYLSEDEIIHIIKNISSK